MRKLIMWNLMSLDGRFEGEKSWDLGWHELAWGEELDKLSIDQLRAASGLLFGRVTYEGMAAYWTTAQDDSAEVAELMNSIPKYVFSRSLGEPTWKNTKLVRGDAAQEVRRLKEGAGGDLLVFGSSGLSATLIEAGLFDEYRICLVPLVLGAGKPLFPSLPARLGLRLLESRRLGTGCVILRYAADLRS